MSDAERQHEQREKKWAGVVAAHERRASLISGVRLVTFLAAGITVASGVGAHSPTIVSAGLLGLVAFGVAVVVHAAVLARRDAAETRREVHARQLLRITGKFHELPVPDVAELVPEDHAYARDLDIAGPGSLLQRIDVTHTRTGEHTLVAWLLAPGERAEITARQEAVRELAVRLDFRELLEAEAAYARASLAAGRAPGGVTRKLDARPFLAFLDAKDVVISRPWLPVVAIVLPLTTLALSLLAPFGLVPAWAWMVSAGVCFGINQLTGKEVGNALALIAARRGFGDAFAKMIDAIEREPFEGAALKALCVRLAASGATAGAELRVLDRWAGLADLRTQGMVHFFVNHLLLWDLTCLARLEHLKGRLRKAAPIWFAVIGEMEALASLSLLLHQDSGAILPEIVDDGTPFEAEALGHPLLAPDVRVTNAVALQGPGSALVVTGSNMAGKSTLLRAVGLDVALALAGGPVIATRLRVPRVRLRAALKAEDSLLSGASYFHAELQKLHTVVDAADEAPPIFFLLDELLRGTNATARHIGARSVVEHLLARHATGIVATHDVALAALETTHDGKVRNAHFTDVIVNGEMTFDYRLRAGVVKASNALRLLSMAGIEVPADALAAEKEAAEKE